jgi:hypothetical protein
LKGEEDEEGGVEGKEEKLGLLIGSNNYVVPASK